MGELLALGVAGAGAGVHGGEERLVREFEGDAFLHDLFDGDFEVGTAVAFDEGSCAFHELDDAALDEGAEAEASADFGDDLVALEGFDHCLGRLRQA